MKYDDNHLPELTDDEFQSIVKILHQQSGIRLDHSKKAMVRSRLMSRIDATQTSTFMGYLGYLRSNLSKENEFFCNALTTNLTSWFREAHHFEHLKSEIENSAKKRGRNFRIWSAACSTGEEAYSAAMSADCANRSSILDIKVLATDLNTKVLNRAEIGKYAASSVRDIPTHCSHLYDVDEGEDVLEVKSKIRRMIDFKPLNLLANWRFSQEFDAVFCRNVLIYFDREQQVELTQMLVSALKPGGILYLGHTEAHLGSNPLLLPSGKTIYRRK